MTRQNLIYRHCVYFEVNCLRPLSKMPIEFYGLRWSVPCWGVLNLGEHLGLEFNVHEINVLTGEQLSEEFVQMNPQHCIPTIVDGEVTLWESRAILMYLANKYDTSGTLYPSDPDLRARVDQRLFFDMNFFTKVREFLLAKPFNVTPGDPDRHKGLLDLFAILDVFLKDGGFVAGEELTIGDFSLVSTVAFAQLGGLPVEDYENVTKWLELCRETVPGIFPDEESQETLKGVVERFGGRGENAEGED